MEITKVLRNPYNFMVWVYPPAELNSGWVGERVAVTDRKQVLGNLLHEHGDVFWGPNNTFRFPKYGITGANWQTAANRLPVDQNRRSRTCVVGLDLEKK